MAVYEAATKQTATLIFLHGLGDTGHGWASTIANIRQPYMKVLCPTANTIPVTLNNGFQMPAWFDLRGLDLSSPEDEEGIKAAAKLVQNMISDEIRNGTPANRIILGGFSQGGALALYSALTGTEKLAGILSLSCWLPLHKSFPEAATAANKDTPILQCHGDCDPIVPLFLGQLTASALRQYTTQSEFKTYAGLPHSSNSDELNDMKNFVQAKLPKI